ncbi:MAG TPA: ROK family protein [Candidatus Woesearchaeota archaeon]|nr:ROK family protein [Candidatus Woesearchaeota archaeon]
MSMVIGVDLGGSKIKGILMDEKGRVIKQYRRPTLAHKSRKKIVKNIIEVINYLRVRGVKGVGVASPGFVLPNGRMTCMPNLSKLEGYKLREELEKESGLKVFLENDANCFALAEHRRGSAKGYKHSIGVIIGTGVGTGIIINNQIYRGVAGGAGEAGHTYLLVDNKVKTVEDLISGPSIVRRYEEVSGKRAYTPRVILRSRDRYARKVYDETAFYIGLFFANLINIFNPEIIVVGGGVSNIPFYSDVKKVVKKYAQPFMGKVCDIKKNGLGDDSGVIGAAELVLSN